MSIILKGIDLPTDIKPYAIDVAFLFEGPDGLSHEKIYLDPEQAVQIPKGHGTLIEERYLGELQYRIPAGVFVVYRSAIEDTDRFKILEE